MREGRRRFRPTWTATLATLLLFPLLLGLGLWQLQRADFKQGLMDRQQQAGALETLPAEALLAQTLADSRYRQVLLQGRYAERQFLLDNQVRRGQAGYLVLTPLRLAGVDTAVLVNRGWVPVGASRAHLPDIAVSAEARQVRGRLNDPPGLGLHLGEPVAAGPGWPKVIQWVDFGHLGRLLGYTLAPTLVELSPQSDDGFDRHWVDRPQIGPDRHRAYAFQWFSLALLLLVLFLGLSWRQVLEA